MDLADLGALGKPGRWVGGDFDKKFGDKIVFWGGGVNTQKTLPFGTLEQIREEVLDAVKVLGKRGGFIFAAVHNIQANIPVENLTAFFESFAQYRDAVQRNCTVVEWQEASMTRAPGLSAQNFTKSSDAENALRRRPKRRRGLTPRHRRLEGKVRGRGKASVVANH
jgi:hypothetical protein